MSIFEGTVRIGNHSIGPGLPCFIIAEVGVNHDGDINVAMRLVEQAAEAGVNAVKFQTYVTERLVSRKALKADYQFRATGEENTQYEMLSRLELSREYHHVLARHCHECGVLFLSTPFDEECADYLDEMGIEAFKISSGDLTNLPFLKHVAHKGRPMILSTGMADMKDVEAAVGAVADYCNTQLALLHCVSNYPAEPEEVNLRAMHALAARFKLPVGFSDHTLGTEVAVAAVALGACVIEKHLTHDRSAAGPDHFASLEPREMREMVRSIRNVEAALGDGIKKPSESEQAIARVGRKSLHWRSSIPAGVSISREHLVALRPGTGMSPARMNSLLGRRLARDVVAGSLVNEDDFTQPE